MTRSGPWHPGTALVTTKQGIHPRFQITEGEPHLDFGPGNLNPLVPPWLPPPTPPSGLWHIPHLKNRLLHQLTHHRKQKAVLLGYHKCYIAIFI